MKCLFGSLDDVEPESGFHDLGYGSDFEGEGGFGKRFGHDFKLEFAQIPAFGLGGTVGMLGGQKGEILSVLNDLPANPFRFLLGFFLGTGHLGIGPVGSLVGDENVRGFDLFGFLSSSGSLACTKSFSLQTNLFVHLVGNDEYQPANS